MCAECALKDLSAKCGEYLSEASVATHRDGSVREDWWKLPTKEISPSGRIALITFEVFDEATQTSRFFPEAPYAVAQLSVGNAPVPATEITHLLRPHKGRGVPIGSPDVGPIGRSGLGSISGGSASSGSNVVPNRNPPCAGGCYELKLSSNGTAIEQGRHYSLSDPRFSRGPNLIVSVEYSGANPETELAIEWYVGKKPVSYSPAYKVSGSYGAWRRAYDNDTIEAGEYTIVLKVNGQEKNQPRLTFWVDP